MIKALLLICSLNSAECTEYTARMVVRPQEEFNSPITCYMHAQAYLASTELEMEDGEWLKVECYVKQEEK